MKTALVTMSIRPDGLYTASGAIHRAYATRHGLDFKCIDKELFRFRPNRFRKRRVGLHFEKFQIYQLLETFDRIIYLDADTLVHPDCPNLLETFPEDRLACLYEDGAPHQWKTTEELVAMEKRLGMLDLPEKRYFNAGVLVAGRRHREIFNPDSRQVVPGRWPEQTLLNYRVMDQQIPVFEMPIAFNFLPFHPGWENPDERRRKMIIHYAGKEAKAVMRSDIPVFLERWKIKEMNA